MSKKPNVSTSVTSAPAATHWNVEPNVRCERYDPRPRVGRPFGGVIALGDGLLTDPIGRRS